MKSNDFLKENIVDDAAVMHQDHEVQMARKECYHSAENAIKIHQILRNVNEAEGLEGWVSAKITLASDYLTTVREYLEYQQITDMQPEPLNMVTVAEQTTNNPEYSDEVGYVKDNLYTIARICRMLDDTMVKDENLPDWVQEKVAQAKGMLVASADYLKSQHEQGHVYTNNEHGMMEELDDSEAIDEGFFVVIANENDGAFVGMVYKDGGKWRESAVAGDAPHNWGGTYMSYLTPDDVMQHIRNDYSRGSEVKGPFYTEDKAMQYAQTHYDLGSDDYEYDGDEEDTLQETSAGSVAGVVNANGMGKKKSQIGSLFGGTYTPKKAKK